MDTIEKRKYKRLPIKLDLLCRTVDSGGKGSHTGITMNVSPGGLFFQTIADISKQANLSRGSLINVEMSIPPTEGLLEFGGKLAGFAKVLRISNLGNPLSATSYGVAVEFCQPPKLYA